MSFAKQFPGMFISPTKQIEEEEEPEETTEETTEEMEEEITEEMEEECLQLESLKPILECNDDSVLLCPDFIASRVKINKRITQKGIYYKFVYYVGFEKCHKNGYFSEEELIKVKSDIELIKNNNLTLLEIKKKDLTPEIIKRFRYVQKKIDYSYQQVLIDPYNLGLWLGDGNSDSATLTNMDSPLIDAWTNYGKSIGCNVHTGEIRARKSKVEDNQTAFITTYHIVQTHKNTKKCTNYFLNNLRHYNLIKNKHIPKEYLENTFDVRLNILAGLIDTDGSLDGQIYEISQVNPRLSNDIIVLSKSLGFYTRYTIGQKSCMHKGTKRTGTYYRIIISLNQFTMELPVLLDRKKWKYQGLSQKNMMNPLIDIDGNLLEKKWAKWTDEMKIYLYSIVEKFKKLMPNKPIPWKIIYNSNDIFKNTSSSESLRTMYDKNLYPNQEVYNNLMINMDLDITYFIEESWMEKYQTINTLLDNGEEINSSKNVSYNTWITNQKNSNIKCPYKTKLINELHNKFIQRPNNKANWGHFVTKFAKENNISYNQAIINEECKEKYKLSKT